MNRPPLYYDVSPSKPIEFEDVEEPTPIALVKALETIEDSLFGSPDDASMQKSASRVRQSKEAKEAAKKASKSMPLPTNSLAAAVAAARERREAQKDEDEDGEMAQVSMRNLVERMPSDRQTYRSTQKQSLEWTRIMPHIRARGHDPQAKSPATPLPALELEGIQAYLTTPSSHSPPSSHLPFAPPSPDEQFEIQGASIKPGGKGSIEEEEEVLASHGSLNEYFALHDDSMNQHISSHHLSSFQGKKGKKSQRTSKALKTNADVPVGSSLARPGLLERDDRAEKLGLPPMEPARNLLSQAVDVLMDQLWFKILPSFVPLVMKRIEARKKTSGDVPGSFGLTRLSKRPSGIPSNLEALPESETLDHFEGRVSGTGSYHRRNRSSGGHLPFFSPSPRTSVGGNSSTGPQSPLKRRSWYDGIGSQSAMDESKVLAANTAPSLFTRISDPPTESSNAMMSAENSFVSVPSPSPLTSPTQHVIPQKSPAQPPNPQMGQHRTAIHLVPGPKKQTMKLGVLTPSGWQQSLSPDHPMGSAPSQPQPQPPLPISHKQRTGVIPSPPSHLQPINPAYSSHVNQMSLNSASSSTGMFWQSSSSTAAFQRTAPTISPGNQPGSRQQASVIPSWLTRRSLPSISPSTSPAFQGSSGASERSKKQPFPFPSSQKADQ